MQGEGGEAAWTKDKLALCRALENEGTGGRGGGTGGRGEAMRGVVTERGMRNFFVV